jgi:Asp-tRNA(Asn)/Glu-tRNA(Gln) amidotransferase A subunit family amidase
MTTESVDIHYLTISEPAGLLSACALSPVEVTRAQQERVDAFDGRRASFPLTAEAALDPARRVSERRNEIGSSRAWR